MQANATIITAGIVKMGQHRMFIKKKKLFYCITKVATCTPLLSRAPKIWCMFRGEEANTIIWCFGVVVLF